MVASTDADVPPPLFQRDTCPNPTHAPYRPPTAPPSPTVLLFENLHRFLGSVELIQAVARQAIAGKHNRAFIVVLAPVTQIPPELDKLFVCVDHELPDHAQLEEIARGVATQDGELPSGDELPRVIDAAKGLTRSEAENAYSLSLVRHGTLKAETLWEIKAGQLKKSGLVSIHHGSESFQQLGGLLVQHCFCKSPVCS